MRDNALAVPFVFHTDGTVPAALPRVRAENERENVLDIITAVLEELLGTGGNKQAQGRRPAGGQNQGGQPSFEDFVKKVIGAGQSAAPEREMVEPEPPPPSAPPPPRREQKPQKSQSRQHGEQGQKNRQVDQAYRKGGETLRPAVPPPDSIGGTFALPAELEVTQIAESALPTGRTKRTLPSYVSRLRDNPSAARDALVYSEIFGPPLANRRPNDQR